MDRDPVYYAECQSCSRALSSSIPGKADDWAADHEDDYRGHKVTVTEMEGW